MTRNETDRAARYDALFEEASKHLESIGKKLEAHAEKANAKPNDWGAVGDVGRLVELLREVDAFLGGTR